MTYLRREIAISGLETVGGESLIQARRGAVKSDWRVVAVGTRRWPFH